MASNEKILGIVEALLNKTEENGCTEAEASLAAEKAAELMSKYGIEIRQVRKDHKTAEAITHVEMPYSSNPGRQGWQEALANGIARVAFCKVVSSRWKPALTFIGTPTEIELSQHLYEWMLMQVAYISAMDCKGKGKRYQDDFALGCATRVAKRLLEKFRLTVEGADATAIIRSNAQELQEYAEKMFPRLTTGGGKTCKNYGAFAAGSEAGNKVKLDADKSIGGGPQPRISGGMKALNG